ncbi:MAG: hypothetical protein QXL19_10005 [Ignisphaera sp.]
MKNPKEEPMRLANATRSLIQVIGTSIVVRRSSLRRYTREVGRSDTLLRLILHKLRKKGLIYVNRDLIVNVPLLILHYSVARDLNLGKEDEAIAEVAKNLLEMGIDEVVAKDLVSKVVAQMLPEYRQFADSISQYYKSWYEIIDSIRKSGEIDHVINLFLIYLGFLISESISLTHIDLQGQTLLNEEFIGTKLFLHSLSKYVRSKHAEELSKAKEKLVKEIERLKTDKDRHTRFYATLLLEHTLSTAMDKILPKLYIPITLILYKKQEQHTDKTLHSNVSVLKKEYHHIPSAMH